MPSVGVLGADADVAQADQRLEGTTGSISGVGVDHRHEVVAGRFQCGVGTWGGIATGIWGCTTPCERAQLRGQHRAVAA